MRSGALRRSLPTVLTRLSQWTWLVRGLSQNVLCSGSRTLTGSICLPSLWVLMALVSSGSRWRPSSRACGSSRRPCSRRTEVRRHLAEGSCTSLAVSKTRLTCSASRSCWNAPWRRRTRRSATAWRSGVGRPGRPRRAARRAAPPPRAARRRARPPGRARGAPAPGRPRPTGEAGSRRPAPAQGTLRAIHNFRLMGRCRLALLGNLVSQGHQGRGTDLPRLRHLLGRAAPRRPCLSRCSHPRESLRMERRRSTTRGGAGAAEGGIAAAMAEIRTRTTLEVTRDGGAGEVAAGVQMAGTRPRAAGVTPRGWARLHACGAGRAARVAQVCRLHAACCACV
mmetsp:Transcript_69075/g.202233  ORF Transcript_69075/g.202233 Transcript_69075/m.202233 type:complete len:338 (-) Transcript_69075:2-1015(-)